MPDNPYQAPGQTRQRQRGSDSVLPDLAKGCLAIPATFLLAGATASMLFYEALTSDDPSPPEGLERWSRTAAFVLLACFLLAPHRLVFRGRLTWWTWLGILATMWLLGGAMMAARPRGITVACCVFAAPAALNIWLARRAWHERASVRKKPADRR